jgi:hypothetical protein
MSLDEKKELLSDIIRDADDKLTGLLIAIANEYNSAGENYSSEELAGFYDVRDKMLAEPGTTYTPAQAHHVIRNKNVDAV